MHRALDDTWQYPDGGGYEVKQALAQHLGVSDTWITVGNGSNELLMLLAEAFLDASTSAVYSQFGFAIYPLVIRATGARCIEAPALAPTGAMPYGHDLTAMAKAIAPDTRLVFIANPNNPTGTWVSSAHLREWIDIISTDTLVVLDEAYLEYAALREPNNSVAWLRQCPNLVLLRTFSKAYGLAGIRAGYAVSHPETAETLNRIRPPFNVSNVAQAGVVAALADHDHVEGAARRIVAERERVAAALQLLGLSVTPSAGNFLMVEVGARAAQINEQLLRGGIIVRPLVSYGLGGHLRISIALPDQNDRLIRLLASSLRGS